MKNIVVILISTFLFGINSSTTAQSNAMDEFTVIVDGLGCSFCAYGLEKKFKELKGIKKIKIDLESGTLSFNYPADKEFSINQVESQVDKAGYTAVSVSIQRGDGRIEKSEEVLTSLEDENALQEMNFFVAGNCGMCKIRIEAAAQKVEGVAEANWNPETQLLVLKVTSGVSQDTIEKEVVGAGHDTQTNKAETDVYQALPGCCQYQRAE